MSRSLPLARLVAITLTALGLSWVAYLAVAHLPHRLAPTPLTTWFPAVLLSELFFELGPNGIGWVPVLTGGAYLLTSLPILVLPQKVPLVSVLLYGGASLLTISLMGPIWLDLAGLRELTRLATLAAANAVAILGVGVLLWRVVARPSFLRSYLFNTCLFLWLCWFSFPYLGPLKLFGIF